jgi:hypothetical protein
MNTFEKEYFNQHCYFHLKGNGIQYTLTYSTFDSLNESEGTKKKFNKSKLPELKNIIKKHLSLGKKTSKKSLDKDLNNINGELDEFVNPDGTFIDSKIPILNKALTPRKIMSVTVSQSRTSNDPVTRGYRVYYGENKEKDGDVINEIDMKDAFGFEETKDKDFKTTMKILKKMGIDDTEERIHRTKQLGKLKKEKVKKVKGKPVLKQRLVEKEIEEIQKQKMIKMVEDILTNKKKDYDILNKEKSDSEIEEMLKKNLDSIKKLAKKEGISINKLINILKKGE